MSEPHDVEAEQAVLGAMIHSAAATARCVNVLTAADFRRHAHRVVFAALVNMHRTGTETDRLTLAAHLDKAGNLAQVGGPDYLAALTDAPPHPDRAAEYAAIVRDLAVRRRLAAAGREITQLADEPGDAGGLTERAVRAAEAVRAEGQAGDIDTLDIGEFLAAGTDEYDWMIEGLLERGDRLMLTGAEGFGKTTLLDQIAVCTAAGLHPFTHEPAEPRRVLVIDCENGARRKRRNLRPLCLQAERQGYPVYDPNLWIECRDDQVDLATDRDVSWLLRLVGAISPDIVQIGPLSKLAPRALNDDSDAAPVLAALNMVRARGACVLVEAHAGHGLGSGGKRDMRPRGSAALLGYPEFGYGIRPAEKEKGDYRRIADVVPWRGDREERDWPERLVSGGTWPWSSESNWTPHTTLRSVP